MLNYMLIDIYIYQDVQLNENYFIVETYYFPKRNL